MDNKKILRLFISSTFDDFSIERDALQNQVFPYISEICYQNGYQFFPIDLRWGVSSEAQVDQKTLDICLKEVDKCISEPHPDFLMLIGNRYGWIPLQNKIEQKEFENIVELLSSDDKYLVANWYELDENEIPSSYILRKRKDEYQNDSNWFKIEGYLRNIFQKAVIKSNLDENTKDKYFTSAIEYELLQYLKNKTNKESIFVFNREIKNSINQTSKYFEKSNKLESLKNKLGNLVLEENYLKIDTNINENDQISDQYIEEFITKIKNILEQAVLRNIIRNDTLNEFSQEIFVQQNFLENSSKDIVGRTQEIGYILGYLNNKEIAPPLFLYGESGIGKTSIIAKAIKEYQNISTNKIVYRFCGISKASSNSYDLLVSILDELKIDINEFKINSEESLELKSLDNKKNKTEEFELNILDKLNSIKEETTIFIDSLDQLEDQTQLYWLSSVLPKNLKIVISVLNDKKYSDDSIYFEKIQYKFDNLFEIKNIQDVNISKEIILNYLEQENRKLNSDQLEYINNIYQKVQFPFYLKIISQEVKNWKSDFSDFELPNDKEEAVNKFIDNLVEKRHHNRLLVEKFFSYIFASQFNLNESTLYHILSNDEELIKSINNIYHQNIIYIPLSIWSRFFYDISPFIKENESGNISFFHREFNNSIEKYYNHEASSKLLNIIEKLINESNNEVYLFKLLEIYIPV
ncbi:hypothetical protein CJ671_08885, partial [Aliarcobacter cryaerophilus]